jgi:soluble lytic murein transglycosylase-like protein
LSLRLVMAGVALLPVLASAGELFSYVDADGVIHLTNVPADGRYRKVKVTRASDVAGVYRPTARPATASSGAPGMKPDDAAWNEHIRQAAERYRLPVALLRAVMAVESNFNPRALSEKGAMGLMQLMPQTAREMYVGDVWDPVQNIEGGARYLRLLANQYDGDMVKTLAAYNAGPEAVRRSRGGLPDIPETREYVRKVVAIYQSFRTGH